VRKLALLAIAFAALLVAGCGGGSSSGGSSSETAPASKPAADTPEAAWAKEVEGVMSYFENHVSAQAMPAIQDTYAKVSLEPLYRTYSANLAVLANELGRTKAPAACSALHARITTLAHRVADLTHELSEQPDLTERQYSLFLGRKGEKIRSASIELTELTAKPTC
jgi:hypothetical protein